MIKIIAFDADDTLWHNETLFTITQDKFMRLVAPYADINTIQRELYETEIHNLEYFGYGIKGFVLSMIETAIQLTNGAVTGREIQQIIEYTKAMMRAPLELLDHVAEVVPQLGQSYKLMIITKGDLFDQEAKIAQSGLATYFTHIEILSNKTQETYQHVLQRHNINPQHFVMIGNSLKSDILPIVALGGKAIYIPYHTTWAHETVADARAEDHGYIELAHIGLLPSLLETWDGPESDLPSSPS